ncbi:hydrolase [Niveibacterium sp. SC-1]|uniref:hydrolase n=1 Tax=Niveibacterium sp. SC-1 TaxID=3135646 RepID=UPI00311E72B3
MLELDPASTALVLIDLQQGIVPMAQAPNDGATILRKAGALVERFHALAAPVVRVRVGWSADGGDAPGTAVDQPSPPPSKLPPNWLAYPEELPAAPQDIAIIKRQWNAFHGTELDLQLRRRGIRTLVLGGIATNIGVEGTARAAWELGYAIVLAEDATGSPSAEMHAFSVRYILPRLARVRSTVEILAALPAA